MANLILTPEWATGIYQLETSDPVMGGPDGIDNRQAIQLGKRTEWLKQEVEKRASIASPTFTGTLKAPTPAQTVNDTTLATTEFVKTAIAALVGSAPETLDTLAEIATALGADGNLKATLLAEIGKKANNTDFTTLKNLLVGIPFPYPLTAVPSGCLAFNGQAFNKTTYPELAKKYPSGILPDLRGEFIRGWDNGRGVDSGRELLSEQGDAIRNISGWVDGQVGFGSVGTSGIFTLGNYVDSPVSSTGYKGYHRLTFDASKLVPTADENRPRNVAFQYICLAA